MDKNKIQDFIYGVIGLIIIAVIAVNCVGNNGPDEEVQEKPVFYNVTITLNYEEVFLTTNSPINVFVDDVKLGRQEAGTTKSYTVQLEEGEYEFYLKNDGIYTSPKIEFKVTPTKKAFKFGTKTALTFGMEIWAEN